ncbi:MAG TPA: hypothetical protein VHW47_07355, partial [Acidimicrobiales bacterium]|nr:hypothetical protein [Acidimicrobiales bacterium]
MTPEARREVLGTRDPSAEDEAGGRPGPSPARDAEPGRKVDPTAGPAEEMEEAGLRPRSLAEFVGQAQLVEHLGIVL